MAVSIAEIPPDFRSEEDEDEPLEPRSGAENGKPSPPEPPAKPTRGSKKKAKIPPRPPHFKFHSDKGRGYHSDDFFHYWEKITPEWGGQLVAYIYRTWPYIQIPDPKDPKKFSMQVDKVPGETPIKSTEDFIHRYGSGDFAIRLNECAVLKKTIASCTLRLRDNDHPIVIDDLTTVVWDDPVNKVYREELRQRGVKIPGDEGYVQEEAEDVAQTAVVDRLGGLVERLADRVAERNEEPETVQPSPGSEGAEQAARVVAKGAELALGMMDRAIAKTNEVTAHQGDPLAIFDRVLTVVKEVQPKPDNSAAVLTQMFQTMREQDQAHHREILAMMQGQIDRLNNEVTSLRNPQGGPQGNPGMAVAIPPSQPKSMAEQVQEMKDMKDNLDSIFGGVPGLGDAAGTKEGLFLKYLPLIVQGVGMVGSTIQNVIYNMAAMKANLPPQAPVAPPVQEPGEGQFVEEGTTPAAGGQGPGSPEEMRHMAEMYRGAIRFIRGPLMDAMKNEKTGYEFAEDLINYAGRPIYQQVLEMGVENLKRLLATDAELWAFLKSMPARTNQFLSEFLSYDEWASKQEGNGDAGIKDAETD